MDESLRAQIDSNLSHLHALIHRGRRICDSLVADPSDKSAVVANRAWQQDCGLIVHQLSGGSKAHWLSRSFSEAFLMRNSTGEVIETVEPAEIMVRLLAVLDQAALSLSQLRDDPAVSSAPEAPPVPRRFEFVHNENLRPVLEQAYAEGRDAFDRREYTVSLIHSSGILEAIVTDALEKAGRDSLNARATAPEGPIADWSFNDRLRVAEEARIIRGGCARLPEVARKYRESGDAGGNPHVSATEQEARRTMQVLHVVMRDLDPGR
jgi:hypothetical protein